MAGVVSRDVGEQSAGAGAPFVLTPRHIAVVLGLLVWLGLSATGAKASTIPALFFSLLMVGVVLAAGTATRTVRLRAVFVMFCAGGSMMTVMYLIAKGYQEIDRDIGSNVRTLVLPPIEELLKVAPVVGLLVWMRRTGTWALGATDVLILAVASAAGFGWVEEAFIDDTFGVNRIAWMPTAATLRDRAIGGHIVWTAILGGFLGLALLARRKRVIAGALVIGGFGLTWLSHTGNNYGNTLRSVDRLQDLFELVTLKGWVSIALFPLMVVAVVVADLLVAGRVADAERPSTPDEVRSWPPLDRWGFTLDRRSATYARWQAQGAVGDERAEVDEVVAAYDVSMWARVRAQRLRASRVDPGPTP